jgi:4-hydroxybenzoate polyprenyltransferase
MPLALLRTLRPRQWVKNIFVVAPLVFSLRLTESESLVRALLGFALFSLISGCVYVLNDLVDVDKDRLHPQKRTRPIASGALSESAARIYLLITLPLSLVACYLLAPGFAVAAAGYFVLNVAYSFKLKDLAYVDVFLIASFFLLRVFAGAFAIAVPASPWLLICTGLLALFLGFGKRAHELANTASPSEQRPALAHYHLGTLRWILHFLGIVTVVVYVLYTVSEHTVAMFGTTYLVYTALFPIIGILRFVHLATTRHDAESPTEEMLKDPLFMTNIALYAAATLAILYGGF